MKDSGPRNEFSSALNQDLRAQIETALKQTPGPWYAAFDADGTLWDIDVGESFFDYQIQKCGLKLPADPWAEYLDKKAIHPPTAYLWLAQINKGIRESQVRQWAENCFLEHQPFPFFQSQQKLIEFLQSRKVQVFVVSASVKWSVEPAAARLGIEQQRVLGVRVSESNGLLTCDREGPITWKEGKVEALLAATDGVRPILASGNTTGDLPLLEASVGVKLAVSSANSIVPDAEAQLTEIAQKRGWFTHRF